MDNLIIVVLGGGTSPERDVSLRSAAAVTEALEKAGYTVDDFDPKDTPLASIPRDSEVIVFPILHGAGGEDGVIQAELERLNLPYLGTASKASVICFDKGKTRNALQSAGLPVADGDVVTKDSYHDHVLTTRPHVLKVTHGGSSIGTYIVRDPKQRNEKEVTAVFALGPEAVIEELVEGVEITVPVLDQSALPVIEIKPPVDKEFDYENKYNGATEELCPPVSIDQATQTQAQKLAEQAHQALGCRHLSRTDMIVRRDGSIVILETNTIPGMTNQSLFPKAAKAAGMDMPALMTRFVEMVQRDYKEQ